jgi:uncharacterized membrane protein YdbT with pleckstrin-like domain
MATAPSGVPKLVVRPSTKLLIGQYLFADLFLIGAIILHVQYAQTHYAIALAVAWGLITVWTIAKHIGLRFTILTLLSDSLRYESGMLSKSTRSLNLQKVQDVRVDQGLLERIFGIGSITLETAGESGSLVMEKIDQPQKVADQILDLARECNREQPPGR